MGKLRFLLALWLAKLSVPALKITRHNGTDFPGSLALKLCPDFLRYVGKPGTIIAVTGTNGKTTVSNLLTDILEAGRRFSATAPAPTSPPASPRRCCGAATCWGGPSPMTWRCWRWTSGPASASSPM